MGAKTVDEAMVEFLVAVWSEALEVPVTSADDFLASGGTSLAAVEIGGRVAERYPALEEIETHAIQALFECRTLGEMAVRLARIVEVAER